MNDTIELFKYCYEFVRDYRRFDIKTKGIIDFPFDYTIPKMNAAKYQRGKSILMMEPKDYEYLLYNLHNTDEDFIYKILIGYLYYWKVRKKDNKKMISKYKEVLKHYTIKHEDIIPTLEAVPSVYYISFMVGTAKVYKIGYSEDPTRRFKEIIQDVKTNYTLVSVGSLEVIDTLTYKTKEEALTDEKKLLTLIEANKIPKTKIYFKGASESFNEKLET